MVMNNLVIAGFAGDFPGPRIHFRIKGFALVLLLMLLLGACSTAGPTPYQAGGESRYGYREATLSDGTFQLAFAGNSRTDRETVETYFLYRAAEHSGELGFSRFALKDKVVERLVQETYDPYWGPYWGYGYGRNYGSSVSITVPLGGGGPGYRSVRYTASATVVPFNGQAPLGVEGYKDVEQVLSALGPAIRRPPPEAQ
jgi:hypothetical protein